MNLTEDARAAICAALPDADPDALIAAVEDALRTYEYCRRLSRDAIPTGAQYKRKLEALKGHLDDACRELISDTGAYPFIGGNLGARLDESDAWSATFVDHLMRLADCVGKELDALDDPPRVFFDGEEHVRRTRTATRDSTLIPLLAMTASVQGGLSLRSTGDERDWEDLDTACAFIEAVFDEIGMPRPDAGDTSRAGESSQGRLRRLVKESLSDIDQILSRPPPLDE